jgi:hypothetical protein
MRYVIWAFVISIFLGGCANTKPAIGPTDAPPVAAAPAQPAMPPPLAGSPASPRDRLAAIPNPSERDCALEAYDFQMRQSPGAPPRSLNDTYCADVLAKMRARSSSAAPTRPQ